MRERKWRNRTGKDPQMRHQDVDTPLSAIRRKRLGDEANEHREGESHVNQDKRTVEFSNKH